MQQNAFVAGDKCPQFLMCLFGRDELETSKIEIPPFYFAHQNEENGKWINSKVNYQQRGAAEIALTQIRNYLESISDGLGDMFCGQVVVTPSNIEHAYLFKKTISFYYFVRKLANAEYLLQKESFREELVKLFPNFFTEYVDMAEEVTVRKVFTWK